MSFLIFKFILDLHKDWGGLTVGPEVWVEIVLSFDQQEALLTAAGWRRGNWNSTERLLLSFG